MRIFLISIFFLNLPYSFACSLRSTTKYNAIHSLSGPMTVVFSELGILDLPQMRSISQFHPIKDFKGKIVRGGLFLSQQETENLKGGLIFYDESRELSKFFSDKFGDSAIGFNTQGSPREVVERALGIISNYFENCESKRELLRQKLARLEAQLIEKRLSSKTFLFFLGSLEKKLPPLVIGRGDGLVAWMVKEIKLKTYPSHLGYLNWSAKIISTLPADTVKVGLVDSGMGLEKKVIKVSHGYDVVYPGILVPGVTQLEGVLYFFENR